MSALKANISVLRSPYIIDGVRKNVTPQAMLDSAGGKETSQSDGIFDPIVDESIDPVPKTVTPDPAQYKRYFQGNLAAGERVFPLCYSAAFTKVKIAQALIDAIWKKGHFRLGDLSVSASWKWNFDDVGSMAAFYASVETACEYLDGLGVTLGSYSVKSADMTSLEFKVKLSGRDENDAEDGEEVTDSGFLIPELPFKTEKHSMGRNRKCPETASGTPGDWIIYLPFDTCQPTLGASLLSETSDIFCGNAPDISDADYFIDCYEVVRELVEDGIIKAGVTVADGGLMSALRRIVPEGMGMNAEVGSIMKSYGGCGMTQVLFAETPGIVIDIPDDDYDYIDAETLLQDVAYYPIGHISPDACDISATASDSSDITNILNSLLGGTVSEGED